MIKDGQITKRDIARELARKYVRLTSEELDILEELLEQRKYAKGELILKEGEVCEHIYHIHKGLVRQFYYKNGRELTEHLAVDNSIVMCIESLFGEEPMYLQMQALEPTIVFLLPKKRLEEASVKNVNIHILYRKILEESLIISQVKADMLRFETAQDKYLKFCNLHPQVVLRSPLIYVANYLQMTPETLSRVRAAALHSEK